MKYRIKDRAPQHYVGGLLRNPGDIVEYPDEMKPGQWLEPIDPPKQEAPPVQTELPKRASVQTKPKRLGKPQR